MFSIGRLFTLLALLSPALGYSAYNASIRPLVVWHGLGDSYNSPGMLEFVSLVQDVHPGMFVHSVYINDILDKDRQAGFYGNLNEQLPQVAEQLASIPELNVPGGFDAIGFSQGGQFLRAYQERYGSTHTPIHNLITFGSQHMGVSDIPGCKPADFLCQLARRAAKGAIYSRWVQENVITAQYFRDPERLETYLDVNQFLADINNEYPGSLNVTYRENFAALNKLILILFEYDKTVVPKESSWFGSEAPPADDISYTAVDYLSDAHSDIKQVIMGNAATMEKTIIPMRLQPLYTEDWIGLRQLDERGDVVLDSCPGEHMQLSNCWEPFVKKYTGGEVGS